MMKDNKMNLKKNKMRTNIINKAIEYNHKMKSHILNLKN